MANHFKTYKTAIYMHFGGIGFGQGSNYEKGIFGVLSNIMAVSFTGYVTLNSENEYAMVLISALGYLCKSE